MLCTVARVAYPPRNVTLSKRLLCVGALLCPPPSAPRAISGVSLQSRVMAYMTQLAVITPYAQFDLRFTCSSTPARNFNIRCVVEGVWGWALLVATAVHGPIQGCTPRKILPVFVFRCLGASHAFWRMNSNQ